jgi:Protein of unknown function (DUF3298)
MIGVQRMSDKEQRVEIPSDIAATALFDSNRTCCVCRQPKRPVQLHHIDGDPSSSVPENLAVLCFDCHRETQIYGGFDRKLDAAQVRLYKADWLNRVEAKRKTEQGATQIDMNSETRALRYLQLTERSEDHLYEFQADYAQVESGETTNDYETNLCINAVVTRLLQRFRVHAISRRAEKTKIKNSSFPASAWDGFVVSHKVHLFTNSVFSLEFELWGYFAGAAHPNSETKTLNFRLHPSMELELDDVFRESSNFLEVLSHYCVNDLEKQQMHRWQSMTQDSPIVTPSQKEWILAGAGPQPRNYRRFSLNNHGVVIHFDRYQVGSHAEGKYEVFVPAYELKSVLQVEIVALLNWFL